jgi:uncharacterized membrane protein YfcA
LPIARAVSFHLHSSLTRVDARFQAAPSVCYPESVIIQGIALFASAVLGGGLNSVAGGGSFLTFPTLIVTGMPPIHANATSTVALWPGSMASVGAYRHELRAIRHGKLLSAVSLLGGLLGAVILLRTPTATFSALIPYLLLLATALFALSAPIKRLLARAFAPAGLSGDHVPPALIVAQFLIATYGGFFGGGIGILMLAALSLLGLDNIHEMNALKTLLASCINGIAVLTFVVARAVEWPQAVVMLVGAMIGGYAGAATARKLDQRLVRGFAIGVGCVMTAYFFIARR